jgi:hypothetical protein
MKTLLRLGLIVMLSLWSLAALAQDDDDDSDDAIAFMPFINATIAVQGERPADWIISEQSTGVYLRLLDATDRTALIVQAIDADDETLLQRIQNQFELTAMPVPATTIETDAYVWDVYQAESSFGTQTVILDIAITEIDGETAFVMLQTNEVFYDDLHEDVFLPVLESIEPLELYTAPDERFILPIPTDWRVSEADTYVTFTSPDDAVTIHAAAVDTESPTDAIVELWQTVDESFAGTISEENTTLVTDPAQLGGLDSVLVVSFPSDDDPSPQIRQGVARIYDDTAYILLIDTTTESFREFQDAVGVLDRNFAIPALQAEPAQE